jgi:ribosome-associated toxin RatA of RatAB toxin-antitoxin module
VRTASTIDIAAPPELVFRLARDPLRWPSLLPHYSHAREISRSNGSVVCEFVARRSFVPVIGIGLPVAWRSRVSTDPDRLRLQFRHLGGATAGMVVTWRIEPRTGGTRVTIEHEFAPRFRPWAAFVDRAFTQPIAGRTLRGFKALAEALQSDHS